MYLLIDLNYLLGPAGTHFCGVVPKLSVSSTMESEGVNNLGWILCPRKRMVLVPWVGVPQYLWASDGIWEMKLRSLGYVCFLVG